MKLIMPKLISTDKDTFLNVISMHSERNTYYLKCALQLKETNSKLYGSNIKIIKEVNKEVFDAGFLFLTRYIDDFGLQDLIKVLEVLSSTRYYDADKMPLIESITERVVLISNKIDDEPTKNHLLRKIKGYSEKLNLSDFYEE